MIKIALCYVQPAHICFPLFQKMLDKHYSKFSVIYCAFTNEKEPQNYRNFIEKSQPYTTFVTPNVKRDDWRDEAVNNILEVAQHNKQFTHYLFLEQDFLIGPDFWDKILEYNRDFIYYSEGGRIHPAFALIQRNIVEGTSRDFFAAPDLGYDHFGKFFKEVKEKEVGVEIRELGLIQGVDFYHLAGTTQNYACFKAGEPFYKPAEFLSYNYHSFFLPDQNTDWAKLEASIIDKHRIGDAPFLEYFFK